MAKYLLIESRDPLSSGDVGAYYELAEGLKAEGNDVTLFLVQNGVFPARPSARSLELAAVAKAGVTVLADDFSLRERSISRTIEGVAPSPLEFVIDQMVDGAKAIWH
jgi:predicted peroxiredoxin